MIYVIYNASQVLNYTRIIISQDVMRCGWSRMEKYGWDEDRSPGVREIGLRIEISKAGSGSWLALELVLGLGCSAGHGTLSPAGGPLTQSSGAVRMAGIVSQLRPLKGRQKQRSYASQTVDLLNKEPLLFTEKPERDIFIPRLHVTAAFFLSPISYLIS